MRVILEYESSGSQKKAIEEILSSNDEYIEKLDKLVAILHSIMDTHVTFVHDYDTAKLIDKKPCIKTKTSLIERCKIEVPHMNLFNGLDNKETYFGRIADELVRYHVLRTFILANDKEESVLLLPIVQANLHDDEIIVGNEQVDDQKYIRALKPTRVNKYKKFDSYETQTNNATVQETPEDVETLSNLFSNIEWNDIDRRDL